MSSALLLDELRQETLERWVTDRHEIMPPRRFSRLLTLGVFSEHFFTSIGPPPQVRQMLQWHPHHGTPQAIIAIERAMKAHRMSQAAAAKIMNVSRARLNQMLRGKVEGATFDRILQMADAIGVKARVNYKRPRAKAG